MVVVVCLFSSGLLHIWLVSSSVFCTVELWDNWDVASAGIDDGMEGVTAGNGDVGWGELTGDLGTLAFREAWRLVISGMILLPDTPSPGTDESPK